MVCDEMLRQAEAAGSCDVTGPAVGSAQEAAAACVAYGLMSEFASDFGALLAGLAAASEQRAGVRAYLRANSMYSCQRLLALAGQGLGAGADEQQAGTAEGSTGAATAQALGGDAGAAGCQGSSNCWL
jgi:hypothetical protein